MLERKLYGGNTMTDTEVTAERDLSQYKKSARNSDDLDGSSVWKTVTLADGTDARVIDKKAYNKWAKEHLKLSTRIKSKIRRMLTPPHKRIQMF